LRVSERSSGDETSRAGWRPGSASRPGVTGTTSASTIFEDQRGCCAICGCPATWNDTELRFVLDHIDGDASNNHRENLRLICPNCDSQLPTYKSRNRGRGRAWRKQRYADGKSY
jgi:hypothetical protein